MSYPDAVELPAPLGNSRTELEHQEDDPFSDEHHIPPEEDLYSAEPAESRHESLTQPAELQALVEQRANLLASLKYKSPTSLSVQSDPETTSHTPEPPPPPAATAPAETSTEVRGREPQHDTANTATVANRAQSAAPAVGLFPDPRPVLDRVPSEYYSPPLVPRTNRGLPKATDVQGRYILKKAVSRAALELAGIHFTEGEDHVLLHNDPGPIALRDLRVASVAMQHPADWWRQVGPDRAAYPHETSSGPEVASGQERGPERRDILFKTLVAPWKRRARNEPAEPSRLGIRDAPRTPAVGPSRANTVGPSRTRPPILHDSDSDEDQPTKHVYR